MFEYGFCPVNDNQDFRKNGNPPLTAGHYAELFGGVWLF